MKTKGEKERLWKLLWAVPHIPLLCHALDRETDGASALLDAELQGYVGLVRSIITTCTLKSQGQLSHSPDSRFTSTLPKRLRNPSRKRERAMWISKAEKDDCDSARCPVLLGTTAVPGTDCACAGTPAFSLSGPVVTAPPRGLPVTPASLSALCADSQANSALNSESNIPIFLNNVSRYN